MAKATMAYFVQKPMAQLGVQGFAPPWDLCGEGTPDGDLGNFEIAPIGSTYRDVTNGDLYYKEANDGDDDDWLKVIKYEAWMDMVEAGEGAPDGSDSLVKGSIYLQTNATDDAQAFFIKVDDAGDSDDWVAVSLEGHTHT